MNRKRIETNTNKTTIQMKKNKKDYSRSNQQTGCDETVTEYVFFFRQVRLMIH